MSANAISFRSIYGAAKAQPKGSFLKVQFALSMITLPALLLLIGYIINSDILMVAASFLIPITTNLFIGSAIYIAKKHHIGEAISFGDAFNNMAPSRFIAITLVGVALFGINFAFNAAGIPPVEGAPISGGEKILTAAMMLLFLYLTIPQYVLIGLFSDPGVSASKGLTLITRFMLRYPGFIIASFLALIALPITAFVVLSALFIQVHQLMLVFLTVMGVVFAFFWTLRVITFLAITVYRLGSEE